MRHLRLLVQYDGTDYAGFQVQPDCPTIQGELEDALARLLGHEVRVLAASRTDAGVHALGQVVTFKTEHSIPVERLPHALNDLLPTAVSCVAADEGPAEFHARYDARSKLYSYRILNREVPSPFICRYAWHVPWPLNYEAMREAGECLPGEHDFAAFCAAGGSAQTTVRELYRLDWLKEADIIETRIEGSGFLYMMVRIIMGTLVEVGLGRWPTARVAEVLAGRDRTQAGPTAPPQGLNLVRVAY